MIVWCRLKPGGAFFTENTQSSYRSLLAHVAASTIQSVRSIKLSWYFVRLLRVCCPLLWTEPPGAWRRCHIRWRVRFSENGLSPTARSGRSRRSTLLLRTCKGNPHRTLQSNTVPSSNVLYCALLYIPLQHCTVLCSIVRDCNVLCNIVQYTVRYCTVLYNIVRGCKDL